MKRRILAATLVIGLVVPCAARQGPSGGASEAAAVGFDCPGGELNPNRPEARLAVGDVTKKARVLPRPTYTRQARAARVTGVVRAEVVIDVYRGKVVWARVGEGHPLLREAVRKVVCGAQFYPVVTNGAPFRVSGFITYRFGKR